MLREIFKEVSKRENNSYYDVYYLTDTEIRFTIDDDRVGYKITASVRKENNKYIAYGFVNVKGFQSPTIIRHTSKEVLNETEFWEWYRKFYNGFE
jgi:hypothetical protein